jgi:energy-coupling factor transport system permease protein
MKRLDPRTKLLWALAFAAMLMFTANLTALAIEFAIVGFFAIVLGLAHAWLKMLRVLLSMTAFLVAVMLFSFDLATALAGALRLVAMTTAFFVFFQTTAPEDLANALVASGVPYAFAFILTTAMQFVPVLSRKMQDVIDAQRARGIRLECDLASVCNYPGLFAPLLIQSFTLADQLAEAMEARGFGATRRTFAKDYSLRGWDYLAIMLALFFVLIGWQVK